jgi:stringent starvation protein B
MTTSINVKELLNNYLDSGKILIAIDSNTEGVVLPDAYKNSIQVKLNLSRKFNTTVFEITEEKVTVDLTFSGKKFMCEIPFTSIYYVAMAEDPLNGVEVVENMPIELLELAYQLELASEDRRNAEDKDIDFLSSIPADKADKIEKDLGLSPRASELAKRTPGGSLSKKQIEDDMFDSFMELLAREELRDAMANVSSKVHANPKAKAKRRSKKSSNEIDITKFLKPKK